MRQVFETLHALDKRLFDVLRQQFPIQDGASHARSYRSATQLRAWT